MKGLCIYFNREGQTQVATIFYESDNSFKLITDYGTFPAIGDEIDYSKVADYLIAKVDATFDNVVIKKPELPIHIHQKEIKTFCVEHLGFGLILGIVSQIRKLLNGKYQINFVKDAKPYNLGLSRVNKQEKWATLIEKKTGKRVPADYAETVMLMLINLGIHSDWTMK